MACSLSLVADGKDVVPSTNFSGGEMRQSSFLGPDGAVIRALVSQLYERAEIAEDEFFSNRSITKNHIDIGCRHLERMFVECVRDANKLLTRLLETVEFEGRRS